MGMACEVCEATMWDGPLFRVNEKGVLGVWRCERHLRPQDAPDEDVYNIVKTINPGKPPTPEPADAS